MVANNLRVVTLGGSSGLDVLVDPDEGSTLPRDDPSSMGLLQAMWSAMFAMTESAALWLALSPRRWAEIGDAHSESSSAARRRRSNSSAGPGEEPRELPFSPLPFTGPSTPARRHCRHGLIVCSYRMPSPYFHDQQDVLPYEEVHVIGTPGTAGCAVRRPAVSGRSVY